MSNYVELLFVSLPAIPHPLFGKIFKSFILKLAFLLLRFYSSLYILVMVLYQVYHLQNFFTFCVLPFQFLISVC